MNQVYLLILVSIASACHQSFAAEPAVATAPELPQRCECGEDLARSRKPLTPRTVLRLARAHNKIAGHQEINLEPLIVGAAHRVNETACCCAWLAGCCVALFQGCCYQPDETQLWIAENQRISVQRLEASQQKPNVPASAV